MANYKQRINNYIKNVVSGKRIAGKYERLAVERHLNDLKRKNWKFYFDEAKAMQILSFYDLLEHWKGDKAGEVFVLEGWEAFILYVIFGWQRKDNNKRRFNYADIVVARKNGKTALGAGCALYMLLADDEPGAEVYAGALDKNQARIAWEAAVNMAKKSKVISSALTFYKNSVFCDELLSSFAPLSRDTKNKDGLNPHFVICDERHAWKTNELFNVIKSGMGARSQPMVMSITTAGFDTSAPYYRELQHLKSILEGVKEQDNQFAIIFALDEDDDWKDERLWVKANPNLGVSLSLEYMRNEFKEALNKGGENEVNFKTKNLNEWVDAPTVWIQDDKIAACNYDTPIEVLDGEDCVAGFDFASHVDLVALELLFPSLEHKPVLSFFWCPEEKVRASEDIVDYRLWAQMGHIRTTPGDIIDIDYIISDILELMKRYNFRGLYYDPYKTYHGLIQGLIKAGREEILKEYSQSLANMSEPTKELERLIHAKELDLMNNPVLRWMFKNVVLYRDSSNNIKVHKGKSTNKIDGVAALINAIGGNMSLSNIDNRNKIYTLHGLRSLNI